MNRFSLYILAVATWSTAFGNVSNASGGDADLAAERVADVQHIRHLATCFEEQLWWLARVKEKGGLDEFSPEHVQEIAEVAVMRTFVQWLHSRGGNIQYPSVYWNAMGKHLTILCGNEHKIYLNEPISKAVAAYKKVPVVNFTYGEHSLAEFAEKPDVYRRLVQEFRKELGLQAGIEPHK